MELARETLINAQGWSQFDQADNKKQSQEHLELAHTIARTFKTPDGKKVLDVLVKRYLLNDIVTPNDTAFAVGIRQGRADLVKQILGQIEISNNSK